MSDNGKIACAECARHRSDTVGLDTALTAAGVKLGRTSEEMLRDFYAVYHRRGHPAEARI